MTIPVSSPNPVRRGDAISARNTDRYREAVQALQSLKNRLVTTNPRPWASTMLHSVVSVELDYLVCVRVWRATTQDPEGKLGTEQVNVAKPPRIRGSETDRDGVTYSGYSADGQTRSASRSGDVEQQAVTPSYLAGDIIEVRVLRGRSGVTEVDQSRARLVDRNVDGRAWAAIPT